MSEPRSSRTQLLSMGDIFAMPVFLNVNRRKTMSTNLGFLLSILLLVIVFGQGILSAIKMLNREQPQILQLNELKKDPTGLVLDLGDNFNFGISLTVNGNLVNMSQSSLLTFYASYNVYNRTTAGINSRSKAEISFAPCTTSDFSDSVYGEGNFASYALQFAYCPVQVEDLSDDKCIDSATESCNATNSFNISGTYLSQTFTFLQMSFSICDNTNASLYLPTDMQCMDLSDIYNTFNSDQTVKVNFYFSNVNIEPEVYADPASLYFDMLYFEVNPSLYKSEDIFLDQEIVQDYSSLYSSTANYNMSFYSIDTSKVREQQNYLVLNQTSETLLQLNLRRSNFDVVTTRIYEKVQDMLSQVGGFAKSILFGFAFIAMGYARYKYQMVLSNELYDFEPPDDYSYKRRKGTISGAMRRRNGVNENDKAQYQQQQVREGRKEENKQNVEQAGLTEEENDVADRAEVKEYFEYQRKKRKRLPYNEILYLKTLMCCCRKSTQEEELGAKARVQAEEDVDLIKILQKLKEIDKLKILLLDRDQRELFNYIPRPLVELDTERPRHYSYDYRNMQPAQQDELNDNGSLYMRREEFDSLSKYGKLYLAYRGAKGSDTTDIDSKKYNEKLLGMLGPELIRVFRLVDQEVKDQPNPENFENVISRILYNKRTRTRAVTPAAPKTVKVEQKQKPGKKERKEPEQVFNREEFMQATLEMNVVRRKTRSSSKCRGF